jgi:hypothetical protein
MKCSKCAEAATVVERGQPYCAKHALEETKKNPPKYY